MISEPLERVFRDIKILKYILLALAFCIPVSISLAEPLAFAALAVWCYSLRHASRRNMLRKNPLLLPVVFFAVYVIVFSLVWGVRPMRSLDKFHRLLFLLLPFAVEAGLLREHPFCSLQKLREAIIAFVAGITLLGIYDLLRIPLYAFRGGVIFDAGNMRDPQFYMVGICLLTAMWTAGLKGRRYWLWALALCCNAAGLLLHFKRGVWIAAGFAIFILGVRARRWRILIAFALCAAATLALPQVRQRLVHLKEVGTAQLGGRYVLWTETMPSLYDAYPVGMGWCAVTHDDFVQHSEHFVQEKLNHLHNNILQIRLELGWCGVLLWGIIMGTSLGLMLSCSAGKGTTDQWIPLGVFSGFCGLLLNGMVESNFGDTEIMMLYCLLIGFAVILWRISKTEKEQNND